MQAWAYAEDFGPGMDSEECEEKEEREEGKGKLINLVINAGQAADKEDSWVKLSCGPGSDRARPGLDRAKPGSDRGADWIKILVEDNGQGIPEEIRDQIFEPFFTSKGRETGTGLGLSICHRIVEEHGGSIEVDSTPGEGSTFTIHLPTRVD